MSAAITSAITAAEGNATTVAAGVIGVAAVMFGLGLIVKWLSQ
jgi:hypothetical protein